MTRRTLLAATMYLLPIQVPIYLDGDRKMVTTEWHRSLVLLRDSFNGKFGDITVAAPTLPATSVSAEQMLVEIPDGNDGIKLFPSFDKRCRTHQYWLHARARWKADLAGLTATAAVVHAGVDDVYRPIAFEGFRAGVRRGLPTVFVQDTDIVLKQRQLDAGAKAAVYNWIFERMCRWGVHRADLCLLKGSSLMRRYGPYARNAHEFHDTSYSLSQIVPAEILKQRLSTLGSSRPIRLVYCGRLISRKGIDQSLKILAASKAAHVQFDIIGEGPELKSLQALAASLPISVQFLGSMPYDAELLKRLAGYDALLFTPASEDTPRMIFDGYACGLPLIAFDIDYVRERQAQEHATILLPRENIEKSGEIIAAMCRDPRGLADLARAARAAADFHAAENWYRRRAEWTFQAVVAHA